MPGVDPTGVSSSPLTNPFYSSPRVPPTATADFLNCFYLEQEKARLIAEHEKTKKEWALSTHERHLANLDFMARMRMNHF